VLDLLGGLGGLGYGLPWTLSTRCSGLRSDMHYERILSAVDGARYRQGDVQGGKAGDAELRSGDRLGASWQPGRQASD
jgi:hypothetical protein